VRPGIEESVRTRAGLQPRRKRPLPATGDAARFVSIGVRREQYLVALRVVSAVSMARMRCDAVCPSMTLSAEKSPWTRKHL
jgi:hypothetical protein